MNNKFEYINKEITEAIQNKEIAGANVFILKDGKEIYKNSFGYADIEKKIPMKSNTIFRMFSMSKIVTSVAVMILFERGVIDLYDPVYMYLESFKNQLALENGKLVSAKRDVTIRDLLNMTSGVCYPGDTSIANKAMDDLYSKMNEKILKGESVKTVDFCNAMGKIPLEFQPGEKWMYGSSADVLGAIVEVASGKRFGEFLKDEIFTPLEMNDTGFFIDDEKINRLAQVYKTDENNELKVFRDNNLCVGRYLKENSYESGGAGLLSTIEDYSKFALMLVNKGEYKNRRILGRKTVDLMTKNGLNEKQLSSIDWEYMKGYGYGNLVRILMNKSKASTNASEGEFGWDGWLGTYVSIDPVEKMVFLHFIQKCDTGTTRLVRKLRAISYSSIQ